MVIVGGTFGRTALNSATPEFAHRDPVASNLRAWAEAFLYSQFGIALSIQLG
jgi:hypothetical protein